MEGEAYNTQSSRDPQPTGDRLVGHIYNQGLDASPRDQDNLLPIPVQDMQAIVELQNYDEIRIRGLGKHLSGRGAFEYARTKYQQ